MTVTYSLVDGEVVKTAIIPQREEVKTLGSKESVLVNLQSQIDNCENSITAITAQKAEIQAQYNLINALEE